MSSKTSADSAILRDIRKQLRLIDKRLDALEAVSHKQPDMKVLLREAKTMLKEVERVPNATATKSVVRC